MSLVNDLLIEAERRRGGRGQPRAMRLDDLVPARASSDALVRGRRAQTVILGLAALAGLLLVGVAAHLSSIVPHFERAGTGAAETPPPVPPVAARRDAAPSPLMAASEPARTRIERPVRIESISLERLPGTTRLRIVADGRAVHTLEHDPRSGRLELVLANAALTEPTAPIDLLDTPIRTLDLRAESPDLRLRLALDADVHTQSRWLALERGAALVVDLQSPSTSRPADSIGASPSERGTDRRAAPVGAAAATDGTAAQTSVGEPKDDARVAPSAESPERSTATGSSLDSAPAALAPLDDAEAAYTDEAIFAAIAPEGADRVYSPSLGDPAALRIEPSQREREREERAERIAKRTGALASARRARTMGRFEEADAQYAEIVLLSPSDPVPLVEWADVLVALDRVADAFALVDSARERAPRDQTLLIAKARLLERTGDLTAAIALLDRSGLALTEAPDVHALAAAYQQRAGHHEAAIERYEQILRRFPEESRGWMGLGISLEAVGRKREARDVYRIALSVAPLPGGARHWVTGRLAALGEKD